MPSAKIIRLDEYRQKRKKPAGSSTPRQDFLEITLHGFNSRGAFTGKIEDRVQVFLTSAMVEAILHEMGQASKKNQASPGQCPPNLTIDQSGIVITCLGPDRFQLGQRECPGFEIQTFFKELLNS